jgi:hypothetical protein
MLLGNKVMMIGITYAAALFFVVVCVIMFIMIGLNCGYAGTEPVTSDQEDCHIQGQHENPPGDNTSSGDWLGTVQQFIIIVPSEPLVDTITETVITS